jgi:hypothetical protein
MSALGGALTLGLPIWHARAADAASSHANDWRWLVGNWDVWHRRLKEHLAANDEWQEFDGKSALWLTMDGLRTVDDNIVDLPDGTYRGLTLRAFDPRTDNWALWWLDGRNPTRIDPPVLGGFESDDRRAVPMPAAFAQPASFGIAASSSSCARRKASRSVTRA